jgi:hypothetical protein
MTRRRRRHQRFALSNTPLGTLEVLERVDLEQVDDRELFVMARTAAPVGEEVTLYLADETRAESIRGRVIESRLVVVNEDVRYQVRVARLDEKPAPKGPGLSVRSRACPRSNNY